MFSSSFEFNGLIDDFDKIGSNLTFYFVNHCFCAIYVHMCLFLKFSLMFSSSFEFNGLRGDFDKNGLNVTFYFVDNCFCAIRIKSQWKRNNRCLDK